MTPEISSTLSTLTAGIVMVYIGARKGRLELRRAKIRCPVCGKLYRRGDVCRCSRS